MWRDDELERARHGLSLGVRHCHRDAEGSAHRKRVRRVRRIALPAIAEVPVVRVRRRAPRDARGEIDADSRRTLDESRRGRLREVDGGRGRQTPGDDDRREREKPCQGEGSERWNGAVAALRFPPRLSIGANLLKLDANGSHSAKD